MADMESHYGFSSMPFGRDMPAGLLYKGNDADELVGRLKYAAGRRLFALVTGDSGTGKTTLLRRFCEETKDTSLRALYVADSKLTPRALYKELLRQLGVEARFHRESAKGQLHREIGKLKAALEFTPLVIVDEAHLMGRETLEEVRFLLNCEMDSESPLALILSGQSELWDKLRFKSFEAIRQRVDIHCVVNKLDRSQTGEYIRAHLAAVGCDREIFTEAAADDIYKFSGGVCRLINKCCISCLMYGAQNRKASVDDRAVKLVAESELRLGGRT
jgi:type II secretory pathway predicted ATPase ExeA